MLPSQHKHPHKLLDFNFFKEPYLQPKPPSGLTFFLLSSIFQKKTIVTASFKLVKHFLENLLSCFILKKNCSQGHERRG